MSFFRKEKVKYAFAGPQELQQAYQNLIKQGANLPYWGLGSLSANYIADLISGRGLNPYEPGSPYHQFQEATMRKFQQEVMPQLAAQAASSGLLRGSSSESAVARASASLGNLLQQQAYQAYQDALNRQYNAAMTGASLPMQQAQLLSGIGAQYGSMYQPVQYMPSGLSQLIGGLASIAGPITGAILGSSSGRGVKDLTDVYQRTRTFGALPFSSPIPIGGVWNTPQYLPLTNYYGRNRWGYYPGSYYGG